MLLDRWMPAYDFTERHRIEIAAPQPAVWDALLQLDVAESLVCRALLGLRTLPTRLFGAGSDVADVRSLTLRGLPEFGFVILDERPPEEIVLGVTGRFWTLAGTRVATPAAEFTAAIPPGHARAAWNFHLSGGGTTTVLSTETRIRCADPAARRAFGRYWRVVQPGSGLIRRIILRMVRRRAVSA